MAGKFKWSEDTILRMQKEGIGAGTGADYQPWIRAEKFNSLGRARRVWSPKTGRTHHLLSDGEYNLFLALEWQQSVEDIREQFPLDRELTQEIARELGVHHHCYPGTNVPAVMTADFVVTQSLNGKSSLVAYNVKRDEEAEDEESLLKLEIQRSYFELMGFQHHLVFNSQVPLQVVRNIDWIRDAIPKPGEVETCAGTLTTLTDRMAGELASSEVMPGSLSDFCARFDERHGAKRGTGLRVARILMSRRILSADLSAPKLESEPIGNFRVAGDTKKLRMVGGK